MGSFDGESIIKYVFGKKRKLRMNMMNFFNSLFHTTSSTELKEILDSGAILLDVRTISEFNSGHVKNSRNIPLDEIEACLSLLDREQAFVVVCASGVRSKTAVSILRRHGFTEIYNGGSWSNFI